MDAKYLSDNVNFALTEALSSMAVSLPEDGVDYIGKYLLQFVERKNLLEAKTKEQAVNESKAVDQKKLDCVQNEKATAKAAAVEEYNQVLEAFVSSLAGISSNKQEAMDKCTSFLSEYLKVPASYVAVKKTAGEVESLNYISASPGQEHIIGSKVIKQPEDAEEVEPRSGVSFAAFKLPEVVEEEEQELAEGEEPPPKVIPVPSPLIIDNVMRNGNVKFFGVPKLGALGAVPLSYASIDHDSGCEIKTNDDGVPFYAENAIETPLILCIDTIGKYRRLEPAEIAVVQAVGDVMVSTLVGIEKKMYADQITAMDQLKPLSSAVADSLEKSKGEEDTVGSASVEDLDEEAKAEQGPMKEAIARAQFWTQKLINPPFRTYFRALQDYRLPAPAAVAQLFFATGLLLGIAPDSMRDPCKDLSWDAIKETALASLCSDAFSFSVEEQKEVARESSVAKIREFCDASNLFDPSAYPANMQGVVVASIWLQKNLAAREAAVAYFKEVKQEEIEIVI